MGGCFVLFYFVFYPKTNDFRPLLNLIKSEWDRTVSARLDMNKSELGVPSVLWAPNISILWDRELFWMFPENVTLMNIQCLVFLDRSYLILNILKHLCMFRDKRTKRQMALSGGSFTRDAFRVRCKWRSCCLQQVTQKQEGLTPCHIRSQERCAFT